MNENDHSKIFIKNFLYYANKSGWTFKEIAQKIYVSPSTITDWCKGRTYPRMDKIESLAAVFGVEKSDLIEAHSVDNQHYRTAAAKKIADELIDSPQMLDLWQKIKKLSNNDMTIVNSLLDSLTKDVK
jgi:transcriptional regulator with XRE-family HTH domain